MVVVYQRSNRVEKKICIDLEYELMKQSKNFATNNGISLKLMVHEGLKLFMQQFSKQKSELSQEVLNQSLENQKHLIEINKSKARQEYNLD